MAHVGAWVPADKFELTPVDAIFVRMGARDAIMSGQVRIIPKNAWPPPVPTRAMGSVALRLALPCSPPPCRGLTLLLLRPTPCMSATCMEYPKRIMHAPQHSVLPRMLS
jgi:hypothetical protein